VKAMRGYFLSSSMAMEGLIGKHLETIRRINPIKKRRKKGR
jgi:hypothetical protein